MENGRRPRAAVVGGVNIDIGGTARAPLVMGDSNPGAVRFSLGGVGRNIAHNLSLLGVDVRLLTALGEDLWADRIEGSCALLGIDLTGSLIVPGQSTSTYLYLAGPEGDMALAVSDMDIVDRISPAALEPLLQRLKGFDALVLDANLSEASLRFLAERTDMPLYADAVSAAKAPRLLPILPRLAALKPNRLEAEALTGETDPERAARALLAAGVGRVFLTLGEKGMMAAQGEELVYLPRRKVKVLSTTGAGDAATAAMVWSGMQGFELERAARFSQLAGATTCECLEANNPRLAELPEQFGMRSSELGIV